MNRRSFLTSALAFGGLAALHTSGLAATDKGRAKADAIGRVVKTDEEWKRLLTPEQYEVARRAGTEAPGSSPLNDEHRRGTFLCVCCDLSVFSSKAKFESHTGWPSFWQPISKQHVREKEDRSLADVRTEVLCARCDAHLGHVFDDGPEPTGLRYCMNGVALKFVAGKA
ncbi:MAG: peptide-methionine (R)-S-oxide reductase, partial [Acidobacteriota bacterium]|jgi:peptide-methionine (R)-S-oxide reductase|nr:peptide-methionine (R)-S-oxide reductase [Acidobacteriota bacterium]